jgi:hypothetical protein
MANKKIKRTIFFHELTATIDTENSKNFKDSFILQFENFQKMYTSKNEARFFHFDVGRKYMISDILFLDEKTKVRGKILSIRADVFPQLMEENDTLVDIDAQKYIGVVEATHFFCSIKKNKIILAIEYNLEGAKESDFVTILRQAGRNLGLFKMIDWTPLTQNTLEQIEERAGRVSEFIMKIHRTNIEQLDADLELTKIFGDPQDHFKSTYATYELKFDYRKQSTSEIRKFITKARNLFKRKPQKMSFMDTFKFKAEDTERGNKLAVFDLLADLLKREREVDRKNTSKVLVSSSMYEELHSVLYDLELL